MNFDDVYEDAWNDGYRAGLNAALDALQDINDESTQRRGRDVAPSERQRRGHAGRFTFR